MKNMVAPTFKSARAELKLGAITRDQPGQKPREVDERHGSADPALRGRQVLS
jgi:hypothetical protein